MEHIRIEFKGNIHRYTELTADYGYCFYDVDAEERQYMTSIATPILDETELIRKFVVVQGDAEKMNEELEKEIVE
jgi:hypothetical protein